MKKLLVLLAILIASPLFSQEEEKKDSLNLYMKTFFNTELYMEQEVFQIQL